MAKKQQRSEVIVGLFVILGLAFLGWLILQFGQLDGDAKGGYPLTVEVRDASGIREGVPVRLGGVDIGTVASEPELSDNFTFLKVALLIFEGRKIPRGSEVKVGTSGLMGDSFIRVVPPLEPAESFFAEGDEIQAAPANSLDDLAGSAEDALEKVGEAVEGIQGSVRQLDQVFVRLEEGLLDEQNMDNLKVLLSELRSSSEKINAASDDLGPLLTKTGATMDEVREAATAAKETFVTVDSSVLHFSGAIDQFSGTLDRVEGTLGRVDGTLDELENGDGLAGALLRDTELKRDVESFMEKLDANGVLFYPLENGLFRGLRGIEKSDAPEPWNKKR